MTIESILTVHLFESFGKEYPLVKTSRDSTGLIIHVGGGSTLRIGGTSYHEVSGSVSYLREGERYRVELDDNYMKCYVINFRCKDPGDYFILSGCADLIPRFEAVFRMWKRTEEDPFAVYDCTSLIYALYAEALRRKSRAEPALSPALLEHYRAALSYLRDRFRDPDLTVSDLAAHCGVSERWLSEIFSEAGGKSPKDCITDLRISYAKELLSGNRSITEIAEASGFRDVYQFSRCFRSACGQPPREFRRNLRP